MRVGDYKLIFGAVGVDTVIPDQEYPCTDCCPLRRPPLPPVGGNAVGGAGCGDGGSGRQRRLRESEDEAVWPSSTGNDAVYTCTIERPCLFDVVNDHNESVNLALSPAHAATLKQIRARIDYHYGRMYTKPIDQTNFTAAQYQLRICVPHLRRDHELR